MRPAKVALARATQSVPAPATQPFVIPQVQATQSVPAPATQPFVIPQVQATQSVPAPATQSVPAPATQVAPAPATQPFVIPQVQATQSVPAPATQSVIGGFGRDLHTPTYKFKQSGFEKISNWLIGQNIRFGKMGRADDIMLALEKAAEKLLAWFPDGISIVPSISSTYELMLTFKSNVVLHGSYILCCLTIPYMKLTEETNIHLHSSMIEYTVGASKVCVTHSMFKKSLVDMLMTYFNAPRALSQIKRKRAREDSVEEPAQKKQRLNV